MTPKDNIDIEKLRQPTECYTRCCGYMRPIKQMNDAKQAEVADRKTFKINQNEEI